MEGYGMQKPGSAGTVVLNQWQVGNVCTIQLVITRLYESPMGHGHGFLLTSRFEPFRECPNGDDEHVVMGGLKVRR
jgi:hypothetical protein